MWKSLARFDYKAAVGQFTVFSSQFTVVGNRWRDLIIMWLYVSERWDEGEDGGASLRNDIPLLRYDIRFAYDIFRCAEYDIRRGKVLLPPAILLIGECRKVSPPGSVGASAFGRGLHRRPAPLTRFDYNAAESFEVSGNCSITLYGMELVLREHFQTTVTFWDIRKKLRRLHNRNLQAFSRIYGMDETVRIGCRYRFGRRRL